MTVRMKTKQADYKIEFVEGMNGTQEKPVTIWYDSRTEEYLVSNTPQVLLGMSPYHTFVHSGPYSHWIRPFDKSELKGEEAQIDTTKTYAVYETMNIQSCYMVKAASEEEALKLHEEGRSEWDWSEDGDYHQDAYVELIVD
jgi:hypothetical protein